MIAATNILSIADRPLPTTTTPAASQNSASLGLSQPKLLFNTVTHHNHHQSSDLPSSAKDMSQPNTSTLMPPPSPSIRQPKQHRLIRIRYPYSQWEASLRAQPRSAAVVGFDADSKFVLAGPHLVSPQLTSTVNCHC